MNLTEFLEARIADDEEMANGGLGQFEMTPPGMWSADRVLAECESKRRIVEDHKHATETHGCDCDMHGDLVTFMGCDVCVSDTQYVDSGGWCLTLRALAAAYADHPDYDETWRP